MCNNVYDLKLAKRNGLQRIIFPTSEREIGGDKIQAVSKVNGKRTRVAQKIVWHTEREHDCMKQ